MMFIRPFRYLLLVITISFAALNGSYSQDIPKELYKASTIPDSLKTDANSVTRYAYDEVTVKATGKVSEKYHSILTILNEKGDRGAELYLGYDKKFNTVNSVEIIVYDADGKQVKKYRKSDMYDGSASDDETLVTDSRYLALRHTIASYPTTIEVIYEVSTNSYLDFGSWNYLTTERSVQQAEYKFIVNPSVGFRYLNKNTLIKPEKTTQGDYEVYTWKVSNLKAIKPEEESLGWRYLPKVLFAANTFTFGGLPGDFSTWQNYGKWYAALNSDVSNLSPQRVEELKQLTNGFKTDKEKARFLYDYLQHNMRYVSIQLGIGGLKPFPAMFVDQKKYGDCKALSNYMVAMLKAINVPAYYAIVQGGTNHEPAEFSFPADPFNHIIVCVPFKGDTTWLECTSSTQPFGKLGTFTENRNALLVTEDGGKLVSTPKSNADDNQFISEAHITINADGGATAVLKIDGSGGYRDQYIGVSTLKVDQQKEFLMRVLNIKQPSRFDFKDSPDKDGVKELNIELVYDKFCDVSAGDKQFYRPKLFDLWGLTVPVLDKRKTEYCLEHPLKKTCITTIDLPAGFEVESIPPNANLKFTYGKYDIVYTYDAVKNQVTCKANCVLNNYVIPADKYNEMQVYMDNIAKVQNKKLVIKRKA